MSGMFTSPLRSWMLVSALPLCACQPAREMVAAADPTAREAAVLGVAFSGMAGKATDCVKAVTRPIDENLWPYSLSFGDGGLVHSDDPRFREISRRWDRARPEQPMQVRLPAAELGKRFRVVEDPDAAPACRVLHTYHQPVFDGDLAFVAMATRVREMAGGDVSMRVYRFAAGRWTFVAVGTESYGRPIL